MIDATYSIPLTGYMVDCPIYWKNFVYDTRDRKQAEGAAWAGNNASKFLNIELKKYNAEYIHGVAVVFETEEDFLFFKLKFI